MQRSKSYALLFLLAAFVAGIAVGFTGDRWITHRGHNRGSRPSRESMAKELDLTTSQRAQFDSIMDTRRVQMRELFKPIRPQMDSLQKVAKVMSDSTHEQLKRILNPAQATKLDAMRDKARKREADARARRERDRAQPGPR